MAFTQDSIAKQPTVNDIWSTQSNGSTSTNDSNKTIATQGASPTVSAQPDWSSYLSLIHI